MTFRKLLVPYDGSKQSDSALRRAVEIASAQGEGDLLLLYVVEKILLPPLTGENIKSEKTGHMISREELLKEIYFDQKKSASRMLEKAKKALNSKTVKITTKILYGYPSEVILKSAKDEDVDLIVMGNVGLSGISKLQALGSVSRAVSERAKCPVMIVH
ncbi:MAG: universal stress protein [Thaumarchaeota archaeon]|nr:universal stress protein [Nitrososphaerota archaeon]